MNNISVLQEGLIQILSLPQNCKYFVSKVFTVSETQKSHIQIYWHISVKWTRCHYMDLCFVPSHTSH